MAATPNLGTETTMSCLPTEIISHEIFSKLPAKSLLRFKCVSKSFFALISSSEFIQLHLRQTRSTDANPFLILAGKDGHNLYSIDVDSPNSVATIPLPRKVLNCRRPYDVSISIVGSFDGLICVGLTSSRGRLFHYKQVLINPSTRVFRELPNIRPSTYTILGNIRVNSFGFGFDDLNRDYKLVRITDIETPDAFNNQRLRNRMVYVYSLNKNAWKLVDHIKDPIDSLMKRQNGVLIKNHLLHWMFSGPNHHRIGCFNTRSDKWARDVPLTMDLFEHNNKVSVLSLGVINGCLCLSTATSSMEVIWMMKEYEAKESWVKLFHIPQSMGSRYFQSIQPFFCFRRESKYNVLVAKSKRNTLLWYDIGPKTYGRQEKIKGIPGFAGGCFFKGSFVQIPGGQHIPQDKLNDDLFSILLGS